MIFTPHYYYFQGIYGRPTGHCESNTGGAIAYFTKGAKGKVSRGANMAAWFVPWRIVGIAASLAPMRSSHVVSQGNLTLLSTVYMEMSQKTEEMLPQVFISLLGKMSKRDRRQGSACLLMLLLSFLRWRRIRWPEEESSHTFILCCD